MVKENKMKLSFTNVDRIYVLFIFVKKNVYKKLSLKSAETLNLHSASSTSAETFEDAGFPRA